MPPSSPSSRCETRRRLMPVEPLDTAARSTIRSAFDRNLFVEAGAGTGKTSELVARVVALVKGGHARIEEIVAITFTEAAAAELRERVRAALERERSNEDGAQLSRERCGAA